MSCAALLVSLRVRSDVKSLILLAGLLACLACSDGGGGAGGGGGGGAVAVTVGPHAASVTPAQTQRFTAQVSGASDRSVTWAVDGIDGGNASVGTITNDGLYTPGSAEGPHSIRATSHEDGVTTSTATIGVTALPGVLTFHYDVARTGQNRREYALTPSTVGPDTFGKLFSCSVDGQLYAQPLYVADLPIAGGVHNVVFVATEHDSVYAFDADASPCVRFWKKSFLGPNVTPVDPVDTGEPGDLVPEIGITGTPVVDAGSRTLFVVAKTQEPGGYVQRLHALDLATGDEKLGGPIQIQAQIAGTGTGSDGTNIHFDALIHNQRAALLLLNGIVYIAWAAHGDQGNYHGWILGYDAATLAQVRAYTPSSNADASGIWMSGDGPAVDAGGNIFVNTGNGAFTATNTFPLVAPNDALGDSIVKLSPSPSITVSDFFTPESQDTLRIQDFDLGSSGVVVIPDGLGPIAHPNLVVGGGKEGLLYVMDRDDMGQYTNGGPDDVVQILDLPGNCALCGLYGSPAVWQDGASTATLYVGAVDATLRAYRLVNGSFPSTPDSQTSHFFGFPATAPSVSSNGSTNGIVWTLDTSSNGSEIPLGNTQGPAILYAYRADDLSQVLFSSQDKLQDRCGDAVKYTSPVVMNGKVYVGGNGQLTVYGLKS